MRLRAAHHRLAAPSSKATSADGSCSVYAPYQRRFIHALPICCGGKQQRRIHWRALGRQPA